MRRFDILELLEAWKLYVPGPYNYDEKLRYARIFFFTLRCWCTAWIGVSVFGVSDQGATKAMWDMVRHHDVLTQAPYPSLILPIMTLSVVVQFFAFSWNALCVLLLTWWVPWHLLLGIVDFVALVGLSVGQAEQYTFIPRSNSTCDNITEWQVPPNGQPNFYVLAGSLTNSTAADVCRDMFETTIWQAIVLFHEALIVLCVLTLALPRGHLFHMYTLPKTIFRFVTWIPREMFYSTWFLGRYLQVRTMTVKAPKDVELSEFKGSFTPSSGPRSKMEEVLQLEEAVLVIASELHYINLVRLAQTSKRIRELIFPHGDLVMRKAKFRRVTCRNSAALVLPRCWNCNITVCDWCSVYSIASGVGANETLTSPGERHLQACQPCCTPCFYVKVCRNLAGNKRKACNCSKSGHGDANARLCIDCLKIEKRLDIRSLCMARMTRRRAACVEKCNWCDHEFGGEKVWWICECGKECRDSIHIVQMRGDKDLEAG